MDFNISYWVNTKDVKRDLKYWMDWDKKDLVEIVVIELSFLLHVSNWKVLFNIRRRWQISIKSYLYRFFSVLIKTLYRRLQYWRGRVRFNFQSTTFLNIGVLLSVSTWELGTWLRSPHKGTWWKLRCCRVLLASCCWYRQVWVSLELPVTFSSPVCPELLHSSVHF